MTGQPKPSANNPYAAVAAGLVRALSRLRDLHEDATITQAVTFLMIAERPGIAQRDLYQILGNTDSAASRNVAILSEIGNRNTPGLDLIQMSVNPLDRRERQLFLTSKGRRLMDDMVKDIQRMR